MDVEKLGDLPVAVTPRGIGGDDRIVPTVVLGGN